MVIEFDFEIYKNGDYDKVYLRDWKEPRILCDNGKGNRPIVVMVEDDKLEEDKCFDELCEKIRVKRDRIYNMGIISLSDDEATV